MFFWRSVFFFFFYWQASFALASRVPLHKFPFWDIIETKTQIRLNATNHDLD